MFQRMSSFHAEQEREMSVLPTTKDLFAYLDDTHREIDAKVRRLTELVGEVGNRNLNADERAELHTICVFFDSAARNHHLDEEKHIFPALLMSDDVKVVFVANRLIQDHGWLEENWIEIYPHLEALSEGGGCYDFAELNHGLEVFSALYADHMQLEEELAYPTAKKTPHLIDVLGAGREMAQRRYKKELDPTA
jgi:iron-sulfur cluster repair protein YtfE (RIC family)